MDKNRTFLPMSLKISKLRLNIVIWWVVVILNAICTNKLYMYKLIEKEEILCRTFILNQFIIITLTSVLSDI